MASPRHEIGEGFIITEQTLNWHLTALFVSKTSVNVMKCNETDVVEDELTNKSLSLCL